MTYLHTIPVTAYMLAPSRRMKILFDYSSYMQPISILGHIDALLHPGTLVAVNFSLRRFARLWRTFSTPAL